MPKVDQVRKIPIIARLAGHPRPPARNQEGFTLIETLLAMSLFVVVAAALAGLLASAVAAHRIARERTLAEQTATDQIEQIRRMPYNSVGTPSGNPPGTIPRLTPIAVTGLQATLKVRVTYVTDPTPTSYATAANYKKVVVSVTRDRDLKELTKQVTYVSPPGRATYGGINNAIINVQVIDVGNNQPVPDATVDLTTGPSSPRSDTTDVSGSITFPALTANPVTGPDAYYDLAVSGLSGYQTLPEDLSPAGVAHAQLAPGQTFTTALRVFKAATITIDLKNAVGTPYTGGASMYVGSSRKAQVFTVPAGSSSLNVTSLSGEPLVPGLQYTAAAQTSTNYYTPAVSQVVPAGYPTTLLSTYTLTLGATPALTSTLAVNVRNQGGSVVSGARVDVTGSPLPAYLVGFTDASGNAVFTVPSSVGYSVAATSGALTGTWSGSVSTNTTANVTVR